MTTEDKLCGWTSPSSDTEQEKQDRTEKMIREAVAAHKPLADCPLEIYAKGSYANNTNVRSDSDVDIAVECTAAEYWGESQSGLHLSTNPYKGKWTPQLLRDELTAALKVKFGSDVDTTNSTAILITSSTARVDADVVPCFTYRYYMPAGDRIGTRILTKTGSKIINYPAQQLRNGREKNKRTNGGYKKGVRILKRLENILAAEGRCRELASYFMECLAYNCPDEAFAHPTWTESVKAMLRAIWTNTQGEEPPSRRWLEVNECFFLFHNEQKWTRAHAREFAQAAWTYLGF